MNMLEPAYRAVSLPVSYGLAAAFSVVERGRTRLGERLGRWNLPSGSYVWFHGASLGENQGLLPLIKLIRERCPSERILLTATSLSGLKNMDTVVDEVRMLPFDSPSLHKKALEGVSLKSFIATETELWPNLLATLCERNVPTALVNARISDLTVKWYHLFQSLFRRGLQTLRVIAVADKFSLSRFQSLGVEAGRLSLTGNTKFDRSPSIVGDEARSKLKGEFFKNDRPVVVLGSLHHDELPIWIPALHRLRAEETELNIVVAPRRPERFPEFRERLTEADLKFHLRSDGQNAEDVPLVLLNTLGELESVYSFSNATFIGGTLNHLGGHNPLEAAQYGAAIALGPNTHTIRDIASELRESNSLIEVRDTDSAFEFLKRVAQNDPLIAEAGSQACNVWRAQHGATQRVFDLLTERGVI